MAGVSLYHTALLVTGLLLQLAHSAPAFQVYRLIQLEREGAPFGSQRYAFNLLATDISHKDDKSAFSRYILVVPFKDFTLALLNDDVDGILIILPREAAPMSFEALEQWAGFEQELTQRVIKVPLYFVFSNDEIDQIYRELETATATDVSGYSYRFVVSGSEASAIKKASVANLQGILNGARTSSEAGLVLPTVIVTAYYDTSAAAPELAVGTDSNGSGAVALLELARLYSKLYSASKTQGRYNLLYLLTGGDRLNFLGTRNWLQNSEQQLLDAVDFALCLDTIGNGDKLYLHVSKPPKEAAVQQLYEDFSTTATQFGIPFEIVQKKINISSPDVNWQHEQFARKRILSATLSHLPTPSTGYSSLFDQRANSTVLARNIKFVAEALAKHIFAVHTEDLEVFQGTAAVDHTFVDGWLGALSSLPRMVPYLHNDSPLIAGLQKVLQEYLSDTTVQVYPLEGETTFFDSTKAELTAYRVKSFTFDLGLSGLIVGYLSVLYISFKGVEGFGQLFGIFMQKDARKVRK